MDLRGRTTAIIDPKVVFGLESNGDGRRIIVYEPDIVDDQGAAGWLVDGVSQVVQVGEAEVDEAPAENDDAIRGVVKRGDGEFVIWVDPQVVHAG